MSLLCHCYARELVVKLHSSPKPERDIELKPSTKYPARDPLPCASISTSYHHLHYSLDVITASLAFANILSTIISLNMFVHNGKHVCVISVSSKGVHLLPVKKKSTFSFKFILCCCCCYWAQKTHTRKHPLDKPSFDNLGHNVTSHYRDFFRCTVILWNQWKAWTRQNHMNIASLFCLDMESNESRDGFALIRTWQTHLRQTKAPEVP